MARREDRIRSQALWGIPQRDGTKEGRILREVSKGTGSSATSFVKDSPPGAPEPLVGFYYCRQGRELCCLIVLYNHLLR
jgi:hypothetical protein